MDLRTASIVIAALIALMPAPASFADAIDGSINVAGELRLPGQGLHPEAKLRIDDCDNLLAIRLSRNENSASGPLPDCSVTTYAQSPALSAFDCAGLTANGCAALYQDQLPQYLSGGWNQEHELWALPLRNDLPAGNQCIDGTRQLAYVDRAVAWQCSNTGSACTADADCGAGICRQQDIISNDWVFYTQGGGNCGSSQACLDQYLAGSATMTTLNAPFSENGGGILSDDPNNPFHGYNRVRLKKCNKDAFVGDTTRPVDADEARPEGQLGALTYEYDLYFHGARTWLAAFATLGNGISNHFEFAGTCASDSDCPGSGTCVNQVNDANVNMCRYTKPLPPLTQADDVVLVGWSGGSKALAHTGDWLVDTLTGGVTPFAPNASVHLAFDAPWTPGLGSDTAFWLGGRNMYLVPDAQIPTEDNPGMLPADEDDAVENGADALFSNRSLIAGGVERTTYDLWGARLDASCLAQHTMDSWHCYERNHVLANHVTSPAFTRMAQRDSVGTDTPGSSHLHSKEACLAEQTEANCYDWVDENFRQRAFTQSVDFYRHFGTLAAEGPGAPSRGVFATDNTKHNGLEDPEQFMAVPLMQCREDGVEMRRVTLGDTLANWIDTGNRVGAIEWAEGVSAGDGYVWVSPERCVICPQLVPSATFARDDDLGEWDLSACSL